MGWNGKSLTEQHGRRCPGSYMEPTEDRALVFQICGPSHGTLSEAFSLSGLNLPMCKLYFGTKLHLRVQRL